MNVICEFMIFVVSCELMIYDLCMMLLELSHNVPVDRSVLGIIEDMQLEIQRLEGASRRVFTLKSLVGGDDVKHIKELIQATTDHQIVVQVLTYNGLELQDMDTLQDILPGNADWACFDLKIVWKISVETEIGKVTLSVEPSDTIDTVKCYIKDLLPAYDLESTLVSVKGPLNTSSTLEQASVRHTGTLVSVKDALRIPFTPVASGGGCQQVDPWLEMEVGRLKQRMSLIEQEQNRIEQEQRRRGNDAEHMERRVERRRGNDAEHMERRVEQRTS